MKPDQLRYDLKIIASWIKPGSKVLGLGCGEGDLLYWLKKEKNVMERGIEIEESKVVKCIEKGISVLQGDINEEIEDLDQPDQSYEIEKDSAYVIKAGDELYITVSTSDNEPNNFNTRDIGFTDIDLLSYLVDLEGFAKLPYIEKIKLSGLTIDEATSTIKTELSQYLYQPVVSMKIVNARITVLGEVQAPGNYLINNKAINIYQALGLAGDITTYGNRKKVLIVREEDNKVTKKYVDLTNDEILGSNWYMMNPNDIIYVEPLARRKGGMETFPWGLVTSIISTTFLIMTFMITLSN